MLGLILIYFLGKYYYDLADRFNKSKWGYAILGVATYYVGTFLAGIVLFMYYEFLLSKSIEEMNDWAINLIAFPFGLLAAWGLYKYLERRFTNEQNQSADSLHPTILDDDF